MINKINLPNVTFKIKKKDYSEIDDSYGATSREKLVITIQNDLPLELEKVTLLHELMHAMELNTGIDYIKEPQIEQFAHNLLYVLKNNPSLVKYLLEDEK